MLIGGAAGVMLFAIGATALFESLGWIGEHRRDLRAAAWFLVSLASVPWLAFVWSGPLPGGRAWAAAAFGVLVALATTELVLESWAASRGAPLFLKAPDAASTLARHRMPPFAVHRGARLNAGGYNDEAFEALPGEALHVAVVADSFGMGIVPRSENFVQVAERMLAERAEGLVRVDNYGVPAIGFPEYAWLIDREVLPRTPDRVVLCVFPSNDLASLDDRARPRWSLARWRVAEAVRGLVATWRARQASTSPLLRDARTAQERVGMPDVAIARPSPLPPTFGEAQFLQIEAERLRALDVRREVVQARIDRSVAWIRAIHARVPGLLVVLIPDEFQVSDRLHRRLVGARADLGPIDRDAASLAMGARLRAVGVDVLDLRSALRDAEREAATYHPRDTHWNAHGNRIAGQALAAHLLRSRDGAASGGSTLRSPDGRAHVE